jgi:hypothetical protein
MADMRFLNVGFGNMPFFGVSNGPARAFDCNRPPKNARAYFLTLLCSHLLRQIHQKIRQEAG